MKPIFKILRSSQNGGFRGDPMENSRPSYLHNQKKYHNQIWTSRISWAVY